MVTSFENKNSKVVQNRPIDFILLVDVLIMLALGIRVQELV